MIRAVSVFQWNQCVSSYLGLCSLMCLFSGLRNTKCNIHLGKSIDAMLNRSYRWWGICTIMHAFERVRFGELLMLM